MALRVGIGIVADDRCANWIFRGAITFALFNIPDVFSPIKVLVVSAVAAAAANAAFAFLAAQPLPAILLRGATGFFLAGVYPVGMKIIAGWFQRGRGLALGIMIGALTVGSALPHAVNAVGGVPWQGVILLGSAQALLGALIVAVAVRQGPYAMPQSRFDPAQILEIVRTDHCGWPISATWDTCGNFIPCGDGSP